MERLTQQESQKCLTWLTPLEAVQEVAMSETGDAQPQAQNPDALALRAKLNQGLMLHRQGKLADAERCYEEVLQRQPNHFGVIHLLGVIARQTKRPAEALASYDRAIALKPNIAEMHNNRGNALMDLKRYGEAIASYDRAVALKPDFAEAHFNRGNALRQLQRHEEALASYDRAIALKDDDAEAHWHHSLCLMKMGHLERGLREYEWRKKRVKVPMGVRHYPKPVWLGEENITGKTLFVYWEQGFGDTIHFCRYAKLVEGRGAKVIMSVQQPLYGLLKQISPTIRVLKSNEEPTDFDYHCPLLSLPLALRTTLETIPAEQQYLKSDEELRSLWSARLPPKTTPRIGVSWRGSTPNNKEYRSIELQQLLAIFSPDADWICLQKEIREKDLALLRQFGRITFFGDDLRDFSDTAALLDLMDLVITIDTSVAHLAGAMGKPVWILLSSNSDWRWLLDRKDSPWYPSARLFRQQQIGNWSTVIDQVKNELRSKIL